MSKSERRPNRIGREILKRLPNQVLSFPGGRRIRPLHPHFSEPAIRQVIEEIDQENAERLEDWETALDKQFADEAARQEWVERVLSEEMFPDYYEDILKEGLQRLYEIVENLPANKKPNFVIFPATSAPVLLYAARPILEKAGIDSPFFAFLRTNRYVDTDEQNAEERVEKETQEGKKPSKTARELFLSPTRPNFANFANISDYQVAVREYDDQRETARFYQRNRRDIFVDLSREQLDFQVRQQLIAWQDQTGRPIRECQPLIIDDFLDSEASIREIIHTLRQRGVRRKNITAFAFMSYEMPEGGATKDLFGRPRVHVGKATYSDYRFPFTDHRTEYPPLSGTVKYLLGTGDEDSAFISLNRVQKPWQETIAPELSPNARKNYAALLKALRQKLSTIGEDVASNLP